MPRRLHVAVIACLLVTAGSTCAQQPQELITGLWEAVRIFGPEAKGPLLLLERGGRLVAQIAGFEVPVVVRGTQYSLELPDGRGSFHGSLSADESEIRGFWTQETTVTTGMRFGTPLALRRIGATWQGDVKVAEERFTYYLRVTRAADGALAAYLRNPERNDGIFTQVTSVERDGGTVRLVGNRRGSKERRTLYEGRLADGVLTVPSLRGGTYDFRKIDAQSASAFYPRGSSPGDYRYIPPLQRGDGWRTATLEEAGMSRAPIEAFVQKLIDTPQTSVSASQVHSVLIARHGKLVLEEYFHGYHRDRPHDTRSAAKSLTSVLVGAAMQAGIAVGPDTLVYRTMLGTLPKEIDPRKRTMTLENLLMMRGGHFCDDGNPDAPGNEDAMQEQEKERDWYRYILAVPMDRTPGEKTVYCSAEAHLAGGVLAKAAGEAWTDLFDRLVARPMRFGAYHLFLAPTGVAYAGGGAQLLPRDFLKVAQMMLDDGVWDGRRIVSKDWARKSTAALSDLTPRQQFGYLWNSVEYQYRGRKVRAFFAAGNGGQIFMGIPELDIAIAFTGGNYADASLFIPQREMVPGSILPALTDAN